MDTLLFQIHDLLILNFLRRPCCKIFVKSALLRN